MRYDDIIIGAGHNGLTAAAYLARAGRTVLLLERSERVGGAAVSARAFEGVDARLSRYSYLVSLLPDRRAAVGLGRGALAVGSPVVGDGAAVFSHRVDRLAPDRTGGGRPPLYCPSNWRG